LAIETMPGSFAEWGWVTWRRSLCAGGSEKESDMLEDPMFWVFVLPGLLLGLYAQSRIKLNVTK
jgi:hypothetical protein